MNWVDEVEGAVQDFLRVAELARITLADVDLVREYLEAPHIPPTRLPSGKMAIYGFWSNGSWLKVGKVGAKSNARYTSQHYGYSANSTLAKSLAEDATVRGFSKDSPREWIVRHTNRVNILLAVRRGDAVLSLLESFLHVRLSPKYEGFTRQ